MRCDRTDMSSAAGIHPVAGVVRGNMMVNRRRVIHILPPAVQSFKLHNNRSFRPESVEISLRCFAP